MNPVYFLILTFVISLGGFACIYVIPAARSPETAIGLPFWLVMVWGPSLAAIILSIHSGQLPDLMSRAIRLTSVPLLAWVLVFAPILILLVLRPIAPEAATPISTGMIALMVGFNLILGPLGEELGWRGFLQEHMNDRFGWLVTSLLIGVIWAVWHLPLWMIDSPHAQIAPLLFASHVMLYSVIIGAAYTVSGGSILPAILLHLTFNLSSNLAVFAGFRDPNAWFNTSLLPYTILAALAVLLVFLRTGQIGLRL